MTTITIDCRPPADYLEAHLDKSYNIPLDDLQQRSYELPPRTISFNVVCSQSQLSQCREWFSFSNKLINNIFGVNINNEQGVNFSLHVIMERLSNFLDKSIQLI